MKTLKICSASLLAFVLLFSNCTTDIFCIEGEGRKETRVLNIPQFEGIDLQGAYDVDIKYGETQRVTATGHRNIIDLVKPSISGGVWKMGLHRGCIKNYDLSFEIVLPSLKEVAISGSGNVDMSGFDQVDELNLYIDGSGTIQASSIMKTNTLDISIPGSGNFKGFLIESTDCAVHIAGSGNCEVYATTSLDVNIKGSGTVFYKGNPEVKQKITGSGQIIHSN